jgi:hypothetical protein
MGKLCIIMQHITLCTSCIAFMLVSHACKFAIDHVAQGHEETSEPAQVEGVNPSKIKISSGASNHHYLSLFYPIIP